MLRSVAVLLLLLPLTLRAQEVPDGGPPDPADAGLVQYAPVPAPAVAPPDLEDPAVAVLNAVAHKDWNLLGSLLIIGLMFLIKNYASQIKFKWPFEFDLGALDTHVGGLFTTWSLAFLGMYATALKLHQPLNTHFAVLAATTALAASGGWHSLLKPIVEMWRAKQAAAQLLPPGRS